MLAAACKGTHAAEERTASCKSFSGLHTHAIGCTFVPVNKYNFFEKKGDLMINLMVNVEQTKHLKLVPGSWRLLSAKVFGICAQGLEFACPEPTKKLCRHGRQLTVILTLGRQSWGFPWAR